MLNPMMLFLWDLQPLISAAAAAGLLPLLHAAATNHKCVSFQMSDDAPAHEPLVGLAAHRHAPAATVRGRLAGSKVIHAHASHIYILGVRCLFLDILLIMADASKQLGRD